MENVTPNTQILIEIVKTPMYFGKYKGTLLCDLPVSYLEWMCSKGWPAGKLGMQLATVYEIKTNGLQSILHSVKKAVDSGQR